MPARSDAVISPRPDAIRDLLDRDPICVEIVAYLCIHADAVDTAQGIASWWIRRDLGPTHNALRKLLRHRVVRSFVVGTTCVYGYTKSRPLRRRLSECLKALDGRSDGRPR